MTTTRSVTVQERMKLLLEKVDVPAKTIDVFGSQIVVTCWSKDAACKWATVLGKFARVRGIVRSLDETKDPSGHFKANPGLVKRTVVHEVWRVGAVI